MAVRSDAAVGCHDEYAPCLAGAHCYIATASGHFRRPCLAELHGDRDSVHGVAKVGGVQRLWARRVAPAAGRSVAGCLCEVTSHDCEEVGQGVRARACARWARGEDRHAQLVAQWGGELAAVTEN